MVFTWARTLNRNPGWERSRFKFSIEDGRIKYREKGSALWRGANLISKVDYGYVCVPKGALNCAVPEGFLAIGQMGGQGSGKG